VLPKKTPPGIVARVHDAVVTAVKTPQVVETLQSGMTRPVGSSPKEFAQLIAQENTKWAGLIKQFNVRIE
jgi:tripartite-type tricarboxylate transporter receptor subunit TctC